MTQALTKEQPYAEKLDELRVLQGSATFRSENFTVSKIADYAALTPEAVRSVLKKKSNIFQPVYQDTYQVKDERVLMEQISDLRSSMRRAALRQDEDIHTSFQLAQNRLDMLRDPENTAPLDQKREELKYAQSMIQAARLDLDDIIIGSNRPMRTERETVRQLRKEANEIAEQLGVGLQAPGR